MFPDTPETLARLRKLLAGKLNTLRFEEGIKMPSRMTGWLRSLVLLGTLLAGPGPSAFGQQAVEAPRRPNIVFLYTDDQALWGMGAYNPEVQTPHMDRIAREGALFTNAFVATPVCSPSRAGLFASRYPTQVGITDWINPRAEPDLGLSPADLGWPEVLQSSGYATALFGKWHLGTRDEFHPTRRGYDVFLGFRDGGNRPINPVLEVEGEPRQLEGSLPDILTDAAIDFIGEHRAGPFLVSLHFRAPHAPYAPVPEQDSAPFDDLDPTIPDFEGLPVERVKRLTKEYFGSIHSVDRNIGRLLATLDELDLAEKTIVVFTSDHGYMIGQHGLHHKGNATWIAEGQEGRRPNMFEESIRVPQAIRWPGVVQAGMTVDVVVSNLDFFPTLLDLVEIEMPEGHRIEGRSFAPSLRGDPDERADIPLIGQYDMHHGQTAHMRMIRTADWKLIRHLEPDMEDELYHLAEDPGETRNLANDPDHRDPFETLNRQLIEWMKSIDDPLTEQAAL
ncbi:sulfatase-like hydrolase/transferase [soil metagenome]